MQVIILPNSKARKHWHFTRVQLVLVLLLISSVLMTSGIVGYQFYNKIVASYTENGTTVGQPLSTQEKRIQKAEVDEYYAKRLGGLQAEAIRLKALIEKLASMAGLDTRPYALDSEPAQGGLDTEGLDVTAGEFDFHAAELVDEFSQQSELIVRLQKYLTTEDSIESAIPSGSPIKAGWTSSFYGYRIDPFNGKKAFHHGLDFAGKEGSGVYAVADGIVIWTGRRSGYGNLVEIDHGNGYITRYAHNKKIKTKIGERVTKGEIVAEMGSTGRSTGPHVHFEVSRDGKTIDPYHFVKG
ncbi:MAG: M23 family metallopeptidase [Gammaproteobacteria bacterium]|nr:M23 family metallopeptidase [Gammaproteobacteria bacterium]